MNNDIDVIKKEARQELARSGGMAILKKMGREYFKELRKKRSHYPSHSKDPIDNG